MSVQIKDIEAYVFNNKPISIEDSTRKRVEQSFEFLKSYAEDKVIYGINTGFGPMAQYKISKEDRQRLQYNLVRSHANGTGERLSDEMVKSTMICRLRSLTKGNSGISPATVDQLVYYINNGIHPVIFKHGGVGASGDLVQLAHLALGLIGEGNCTYKGDVRPISDVLNELDRKPLELKLRDGLSLINGTSCMTGQAAVNLIRAKRLLHQAINMSAYVNELVESYDDSFSEGLNAVKLHKGQHEVAAQMRAVVKDSSLIKDRKEFLYKETEESSKEVFDKKVQEYYSIRCVPQIIGPVWDTLNDIERVVENEINSCNDNPIVDLDKEEVFHGGNFHGDYISLEMDKMRLVIAKLTMLMERQLNFLFNHRLNDKFPPFLNKGKLGFNFGMQGMQFTATSTTAESKHMTASMYIQSISCNNDNQDIVSMGSNSATMSTQVVENGFQVASILATAVVEASDFIDDDSVLSSSFQSFKKNVRQCIPEIISDLPFFDEMKKVQAFLKNEQ